MSFHFPTIQEIETDIGIIKVDVNSVIAKVIADIELVGSEADALLKWGLSQSGNIQKALTAAAPVISTVGSLATLAATGNPAAASAVSAAIAGVNSAWQLAETSVQAMNDANAALQKNASQGTLVSDTAALAAGVQTITGANSHVANVMTAAVTAAKTIQALIPAGTATATVAPAAS